MSNDRGEEFVLFLLILLLCALLELTDAVLQVIQILLLHLLGDVGERVEVLLEILQLGVELDLHRLDVVLELLCIGFHVGLHGLGFGHRHDDLLRVDASELLCEERRGTRQQHDCKG